MAKGKRKGANELPPEVVARIREDIARWRPGLWAEEVSHGPACICGLPLRLWLAEGGGIPKGYCEQHRKQAT